MRAVRRRVTDTWIAEIEARAKIVQQEAETLVRQIQDEREARDVERRDNGDHA